MEKRQLTLILQISSACKALVQYARQYLIVGHRDINATKRDETSKECSKLNKKCAFDMNNPSTPLSDEQSCIQAEFKIGVEKRKVTKLPHGDRSRIKTRHTGIHDIIIKSHVLTRQLERQSRYKRWSLR
ncbi:hypothetical protein GBA52_008962 [Prunus armeniaca]|nr:hypothetical protein GBA52_008962 [Prunus armeniaca]